MKRSPDTERLCDAAPKELKRRARSGEFAPVGGADTVQLWINDGRRGWDAYLRARPDAMKDGHVAAPDPRGWCFQ